MKWLVGEIKNAAGEYQDIARRLAINVMRKKMNKVEEDNVLYHFYLSVSSEDLVPPAWKCGPALRCR